MGNAREIACGYDLSGKTVLITGASSGLGEETARAMALTGADLILTARNMAAGEALLRELRQTASGHCELLPLDLSDFASIGRFAADVLALAPCIDVLIANAGVSQTPSDRAEFGLDTRFATNHLGHFLLAHRLLPALSVHGARIVMLSSAGHKGRPLQLDDLGWRKREIDHRRAYGESKTANILFAVEATRRWHDRGIFANAVLPGSVVTGLQRHHTPERMAEMHRIAGTGTANSMFIEVGEGAATSVWAALAPELERVGGLILEDCGLSRIAGPGVHDWRGCELHAIDTETARQLWAASVRMLAEFGFPVETATPELPV